MGKRVERYSYVSYLQTIALETFKSMRLWVLAVIFIDLLFYAGAFGMAAYAASHIREGYDALVIPDPSLQQNISPQEANAMLAQMKEFRGSIFKLLVGIALGMIAWWSLCKLIVWSITLKEKIKIKTLWNFFMLNLAWLGCWMLLISFLAFAMDFAKAQYFLLGLIGLFVILTSSIYAVFIPSPSFESFKQGLGIALKKFHYIAPPTLILFLLYVVVSRIFSLSDHIAAQIGLMLFTLLVAAFARRFIAAAVMFVREGALHK
jgi:hypothetical protein